MTTTPATVKLKPTGVTVGEFQRSINRWEKIACKRVMGVDVLNPGDAAASDVPWALGFLLLRRAGLSDADALTAVEPMTVGQLDDLFEDDPDQGKTNEDGTPVEPAADSAAGKGSTSSE